jgi:DNA-binding MarR family transcriptional regulator
LAVSIDALTRAVSPRARLNRTDLRALDVITMSEGLTAGQLADRLKLTTGAVTGVLDRLEQGGWALRTPDHEDRRRVLIRPTSAARPGSPAFASVADELAGILDSYSPRDRQVIASFLELASRAIARRADELSRN